MDNQTSLPLTELSDDGKKMSKYECLEQCTQWTIDSNTCKTLREHWLGSLKNGLKLCERAREQGMYNMSWYGTAGDSRGLPGTTREMSHDFNLAGTDGQRARTIIPYSPSGLTLPGIARPCPLKRRTMSRSPPRPNPKTDGLDGSEHWWLRKTLSNFDLVHLCSQWTFVKSAIHTRYFSLISKLSQYLCRNMA